MVAQLNVPCLVYQPRIGCAIIAYCQGKVLTCLRTNCRDMNGLWQFPGGAIEIGETARDAAFRESIEETTLRIDVPLHRLGTGIGATSEGHPHITTFFFCEFKKHPKPYNSEPHKHGDWEWVSIEELTTRPLIELMRPFMGMISDLEKSHAESWAEEKGWRIFGGTK